MKPLLYLRTHATSLRKWLLLCSLAVLPCWPLHAAEVGSIHSAASDTLARQGWLACPETAVKTSRGSVFTKDDSASCPQLAIGLGDGKSTSMSWRLLSRFGLTGTYSEAELHWIAPSTLASKSWGLLDSPVVSLVPTRHPTVLWPIQTPGIAVYSGSNSQAADTVPLPQLKLLPESVQPARSAAACFDSFAAAGVRGLVSGSMLPEGLCRFPVPGSQEQVTRVLSAGRAPNGAWDFMEVNGLTRPMWMLRTVQHSEPAWLDFMDSVPGEPVAMASADINGDGDLEIFMESRHHFPDGLFSQLRVASFDKRGWRVSQPLHLSHASGEGEGAATLAEWGIAYQQAKRPRPNRKMRFQALAVCVQAPGRAPSAYVVYDGIHWKSWPRKSQVRNLCADAIGQLNRDFKTPAKQNQNH